MILWASELRFKCWTSVQNAHCVPQCKRLSHLGLTTEGMAVGHHRNYLHIYLEYAYNVVYIKREDRARYAHFSMCSSELVDPGRMIGTMHHAHWYEKQATLIFPRKRLLSDVTEIIYIYI